MVSAEEYTKERTKWMKENEMWEANGRGVAGGGRRGLLGGGEGAFEGEDERWIIAFWHCSWDVVRIMDVSMD